MIRWTCHALLLACGLLMIPTELAAGQEIEIVPVSPVMIIPFVFLLGAIALAPFINPKWWQKNFPAVTFSLGAVTLIYYLLVIKNYGRVLLTAHEYISFISLIGSLYIVSGGIHISIRGKATPVRNVFLLSIGCVISNIVGTTGASMLLLRPYIRTNKFRIKPYHIVFFIFLISNIGGALTPIGDPPLFLGFLKGIPFFWITGQAWAPWLLAVLLLLAIFAVLDFREFRKLKPSTQDVAEASIEEPRVEGLANIGFLLAVLIAVFINDPIGVREVIMIGAAVGSYLTTNKKIFEKNAFNFHPLREVIILFLGIFATMMPALDWLTLNAQTLGISSVGQYFWGTGSLSSFLDNAPTYLTFLTAMVGMFGLNLDNSSHLQIILGEHSRHVLAISLGAVFFGSCTYIGNGPNFMVKSIAEHQGIAMPSFLGYIFRYTLIFLMPVFLIIWFLYFRT